MLPVLTFKKYIFFCSSGFCPLPSLGMVLVVAPGRNDDPGLCLTSHLTQTVTAAAATHDLLHPFSWYQKKCLFFFWCPARGWWHPGDTEGLAACPSRSVRRHPRVLPGCSRSPPASILASRLGDGEVAELNTSTNRAARQKGQGTTPWLSCT